MFIAVVTVMTHQTNATQRNRTKQMQLNATHTTYRGLPTSPDALVSTSCSKEKAAGGQVQYSELSVVQLCLIDRSPFLLTLKS